MAEEHPIPRKLWEHPNPKSTPMYEFMQIANKKHGLKLKTFQDLFQWSITDRSAFYALTWTKSALIHSGTYTRVVDESAPITAVPAWFSGVELNFAENLLFSRRVGDAAGHQSVRDKEDGKVAVTEVREDGEVREVTFGELRRRAGEVAAALVARGVKRGDRVVIVGANSIETLLVWLATCWVGGIFSSSSTDMGVKGILQRTVQVDPKLIFFDDATVYNGKTTDLRQKMQEVVAGLTKECPSFGGVVAIPRFAAPRDVASIPGCETWAAFLSRVRGQAAPPFTRVPFGDPMLICYSSGTTGMPKAIVHSVGGLLLTSYKETVLHQGMGADDVSLQFTTVGWIMYVANVGILQFGGRCLMYDGSPFQPDVGRLVRLMGEHGVTKLGISPRWLFEVAKQGLVPREMVDLSRLRVVTCTGMVLSDQLFNWFYDVGFPKEVHLGNISGGTDIAGCFGIMNTLTPVYVGTTQGPCLGVDARIYDSLLPDGPGAEVPHGTPGELVAVSAFPNVPCAFWNDKQPVASPGSRFHAAYFARFDGVWAHGDFCVVHPVTGNISFLGRADGVLNPSGVRFGSAEVYGVVERHFADRVADSLCVGQRRTQDDDESVMLFLLMRPGCEFGEGLVKDIREAIRRDLSKRHVPKYIFETKEIPTTVNLKKVELPVKRIVSGETVKPSGTLLNPQSLDYYYQFAEVEKLVASRQKL